MKKYMLLIVLSLSLLFLLPLNTYAYIDSSWHVPWDDSQMNHYTSYGGYYGQWSNTITGTGSADVSIYFSTITWPAGKNDYLEFPIYLYMQSLNVENDADIYETGDQVGGLGTTGYAVNFQLITGWDDDANHRTVGLCEFFPVTTFSNKIVSGTIRCNLNSLGDRVRELRATVTHSQYNTLGQYRFFFGTTGWVNFIPHDGDVSVNSIVSAQNATTEAVEQATDAIEAQNDLINDSSTTGANTKGTNFFANFGNHDNAHLSTILTAPLRLFSAMQTECTQPLNIPIGFNNSTNGAIPTRNIQLQCYANFWNREDVQTFRTIWNLLIGGPAIYGLLVLLMKAYNSALDPLNDGLIAIDISSKKSPKEKEESENSV